MTTMTNNKGIHVFHDYLSLGTFAYPLIDHTLSQHFLAVTSSIRQVPPLSKSYYKSNKRLSLIKQEFYFDQQVTSKHCSFGESILQYGIF
jgi:hypothetical protein